METFQHVHAHDVRASLVREREIKLQSVTGAAVILTDDPDQDSTESEDLKGHRNHAEDNSARPVSRCGDNCLVRFLFVICCLVCEDLLDQDTIAQRIQAAPLKQSEPCFLRGGHGHRDTFTF